VSIEHTLDTGTGNSLGDRAGRSGRLAISISIARTGGNREVTSSGSGIAFSSAELITLPVGKRAVRVIPAFNTTASVKVAYGLAIIFAVLVVSAIKDADVGIFVTVRLILNFTTITRTLVIDVVRYKAAGTADSVSVTVRGRSRAISVDLTRSTDISCSVTARLIGCVTTITTVGSLAIRVRFAINTSSVALTVSSASQSSACNVGIVEIHAAQVIAVERISANTVVTLCVRTSDRVWSVVVYTIRIGVTSCAPSVVIAVDICSATSVASTGRHTDTGIRSAPNLISASTVNLVISTPGVSSVLAIII